MPFKLIVDSCCDKQDLRSERLRTIVVPLTISIDGMTYTDDDSLDKLWLIKAMRESKKLPATACPSPAEYAAAMSGEEDCFVVTLSKELSGSYQSAVAGMDIKTGSGRVHIFSSGTACAGEARLACKIAELVERGLPFEEIAQQGDEFIKGMKTYFILQSLDSLIKAGRINKIVGQMAGIIQMRPIMTEDGSGNIVLLEKARGTANAIARLVQIVCRRAEERRSLGDVRDTLVISHCNCPELAESLRKDILRASKTITNISIEKTSGISTFYACDGGIVIGY